MNGALNVNGTVTATNFSGSGTGLTGIGTSNLAAITGTPSTTTYLRGDGTWGTIGGTLSGGVASYIPLWTSATAIGTSNIYQNGSNIGIGTAGATFPDVNGSIRTNASLFTNTLQTLSTSANMTFMVNGQNAVIITSSVPNYVGIGTTTLQPRRKSSLTATGATINGTATATTFSDSGALLTNIGTSSLAAVTGTGSNVVLSASPTLTGTVADANDLDRQHRHRHDHH